MDTIWIWIAIAAATLLFYTWVDRKRWTGRIKVTGTIMLNGGRQIDVDSDETQQPALERLVREARRDEVSESEPVPVVVTLVGVRTYSEEQPAIAVRIDRSTLGFLPHAAEKGYMPVVRRLLASGKLGQCQAVIVTEAAGADAAEEDPGERYVLRLDLATPGQAIPPGALPSETSAA